MNTRLRFRLKRMLRREQKEIKKVFTAKLVGIPQEELHKLIRRAQKEYAYRLSHGASYH